MVGRSSVLTAIVSVGVSLSLMGCGGGGGGGATPQVQVQSRTESQDAAFVREDLTAYMSFYSESFRHEDGRDKSQFQQDMAAGFQAVDTVRYDVQSRNFIVNTSGTLVDEVSRIRVTSRDPATGGQATVDVSFTVGWAKEGDTWRIVNVRNVFVEDVV
jgi:ketosteroid isomerase-like protein